MPLIHKEGKDTIIFASKEDHATPSKIVLPEPEPSPGVLLPNGEINWNCPCLGNMATGPCGIEFREAFSCFHYSKMEPKGADCYDTFKTMQICMTQYPTLYGGKDSSLDDLDDLHATDEKTEDSSDGSKDKRKEVSSIENGLESKEEVRPTAPSAKKDLERSNVN